MKKLIALSLMIVLVTILSASPAQAKTNQQLTKDLGHGITSKVVLPKGHSQDIVVNFLKGKNIVGSVSLSPSNTKAENVKFYNGHQKIKIEYISYSPSDKKIGSVVANCKVSDENGHHRMFYNGVLASW